MSDLISRSNLIMRLSDYALQESPNDNESTGEQRISKMIYDAIQNCISCVEEQPTAYDINKIVEELEIERKIANNTYNSFNMAVDLGRVFGFEKAIEIVKQGGVYDNVCEYKIKDKVIYASCNNKQIASAFCWFNECGDYKYCPYCGKKIKVVE